MVLKNAVSISRQIISQAVAQADTVVDATCGQGNDTLLLAQLVGPLGLVYSFDIQEPALQAAQNLLDANNLTQRVKFIHDDHAKIRDHIDKKINAAMFNLGYLPGGNHLITTKPDTTIKAVSETLNLLVPGGAVTIVAYPGHQAGARELKELQDYLGQIPQQQFDIIEVTFLNQINQPPELIVVQKIKEAL
ncbi:MAG TPA: class I SAM-dependent methyltransferase [Syntrophomonadaceae bacterium]|nr:class I SAM-dependent methyltransferase [Syntrophomonadaceae bacterium]HNX28316.1 class I SAM-dependent methyltransferase [Syntrophomonadaceae bacterium]HPR92523.1 class I SAM-dependent methyltransferase [Syntrophomonadaceae bacterium]